jgi:hypothetical protein
MIHTDGEKDFDLALEVFNEVKKLKNQITWHLSRFLLYWIYGSYNSLSNM